MNPAPITAVYAGLLALWFLFLSYRVILLRRSALIGIGSGDNRDLARRIRVHGNFAEYVPIALLLMLLAELSTALVWPLHAAGVALVAGRLCHAYGLGRSAGSSWGRVAGTALTHLSILLLAGINIGYGVALMK